MKGKIMQLLGMVCVGGAVGTLAGTSREAIIAGFLMGTGLMLLREPEERRR
jgi:hypothetical protein